MIKKILVKSPANIAFIKYWGQKDQKLILPFNDSFSMNLSDCYSLLEIEKKEDVSIKKLYIKNYKDKDYQEVKDSSFQKIINFYQLIKDYLKIKDNLGFIIKSANSFPKKAGIASSASFFSALALGFTKLFNVNLSQKKLSILARLSGSGSACRSIPDGFCWWKKGTKSENSYAYSLAEPSYWKINDLVLILTDKEKKVSSAEGHRFALSSPFFNSRLRDLKTRVKKIKKAFFKKDFTWFGNLIEEEALSMHFIMMTQKPPLFYWSGKTIEVIKEIIRKRNEGLESYFTIDAGENIHLICQEKDILKINKYFKKLPQIKEIIINKPAIGARIIKN